MPIRHATIPVAPAKITREAWAEDHTAPEISDVTGLQTALDGKASTSHDHTGVYDPAGTAAGLLSTHEAAADPHPGYLTATEGNAAYAAAGHDHSGVYSPVGHTHSYEASGAVAAHEAAGDPHPQYLTATEGSAAYAAAGHNHTGTYDPAGTAASAIFAHEAAANPHPTYLTQAEGDALYAASGHTHAGVYEPADATILKDADIGVTVAAQSHTHSAYLTDAPSDGNEYVRKNGAWAIESDAGGSATDLSYTAATRVLASSTGADATLPLVTSSDAGLAPASGGGTTNFLRADGTWAAPPSAGAPTVATLASDQATGANVTPVTLTGLSFSYEANSVYRIWAMGRVAPTAATTGCGFQFDLSSAVTSIDVQFFHQLANTGTQSGGHSIADDASVGVSSGMPGTSTYPVTLFGLLRTTSNTGTAQLRFRSETTAVTTCKAGFTLIVEKVA